MSINLQCKNRIKPRLLREQKTEALLVFIRTTLEQYFNELEKGNISFAIGTKEDTQFINNTLEILLKELQECVVNSTYLRNLISSSNKNKQLSILAKKEEPLMVYYDSIVKSIENNLQSGSMWIPELMVIALLSEWILEEERSMNLYPFLKEFDYLALLEKYDILRKSCEEEKKTVIMDMYRLSTILIKTLKNTTYKINTTRKRKKRK